MKCRVKRNHLNQSLFWLFTENDPPLAVLDYSLPLDSEEDVEKVYFDQCNSLLTEIHSNTVLDKNKQRKKETAEMKKNYNTWQFMTT